MANKKLTGVTDTSREDLYGESVLVGNWFENRYSDKIDNKAIAPAIYGKSTCISDRTVYQGDFFKKPVQRCPNETKKFLQWQQIGFQNKDRNLKTSIKLWDRDDFANNMTTMSDVVFRLHPAEKAKSTVRKIKEKEEDLLQSYGNATVFGLRAAKACDELIEQSTPVDVSIYQENYKYKKVPRTCPIFPPKSCWK